ncbi:MAG: hypothetical protein MUO54_12180 [Anaerolineales bacterium]|nr:hypothetical protein [Anaerolineales bacterium]
MEKIEITTKFKRDGSLIPIEFLIENQSIQILDVGRQWETEDGKHILVKDFQDQTYHLFFQLQDLSWYLVRDLKQKGEPS